MALDPVTAAPATSRPNGLANVQDFLKILLAQVTYQDPLKPIDNQQFLAQLAQFTALEQTQQINDKIDALLTTQSTLQSVGLLGKTVELNAEQGGVSGSVTGIALAGGLPTLTLNTASGGTLSGVKLAQVVAVR